MREGTLDRTILIGVTACIGIMILIGWVAINEQARMESFENQFLGRAIERGATLYAQYCATCHGTSGLGIEQRAPALNNPHLFGQDFIKPFDDAMQALQARSIVAREERSRLIETLRALDTQSETYEQDRATLAARIAEIDAEIEGTDSISVRYGRVMAEREHVISTLYSVASRGYPLYMDIDADGFQFLVIQGSRLQQVHWQGTLHEFLLTTLIHGRPTSGGYWGTPSEPSQMVAWAQQASGPLRNDQLTDIVEYILNWDKGDRWSMDDILAIRQYAIQPGLGGSAPIEPPAGTEVAAILARIAEQGVIGDAARGEALYNNTQRSGRGALLGCSGCHHDGEAAPYTDGTWKRVLEERLTLAQFAGYSPEQYIIESIVRAGDYIVDGFQAGVMSGSFGSDMALQDVADLTAYLRSLDE